MITNQSHVVISLALDNDNDKVFYSTLMIHFILRIAVIDAFIKYDIGLGDNMLRQKYVAGTHCHPILHIQ